LLVGPADGVVLGCSAFCGAPLFIGACVWIGLVILGSDDGKLDGSSAIIVVGHILGCEEGARDGDGLNGSNEGPSDGMFDGLLPEVAGDTAGELVVPPVSEGRPLGASAGTLGAREKPSVGSSESIVGTKVKDGSVDGLLVGIEEGREKGNTGSSTLGFKLCTTLEGDPDGKIDSPSNISSVTLMTTSMFVISPCSTSKSSAIWNSTKNSSTL